MRHQSVPFTIADVFGGLAESDGILTYSGQTLEFEFRTSDSILGIAKSGIKRVRIDTDRVEEIKYKKSLFGGRIDIRLGDLKAAEALPNLKAGEITLSIARKHRAAAAELASSVSFDRTCRMVDELVDENDGETKSIDDES